MPKPVIVRDVESRQRVRDQTRQRTTAGENHAESRAFFIHQITNALLRDCFRLFGEIRADEKIEMFCRFRATAHFRFAKKRIAKRLNGFRRALRFATDFLP